MASRGAKPPTLGSLFGDIYYHYTVTSCIATITQPLSPTSTTISLKRRIANDKYTSGLLIITYFCFAFIQVLKEMAMNAPAAFYVHISAVFDGVAPLLVDKDRNIREAVANVLGACLSASAQRGGQFYLRWHCRCFDMIIHGLKNTSEVRMNVNPVCYIPSSDNHFILVSKRLILFYLEK